jgi:hypothetical protein
VQHQIDGDKTQMQTELANLQNLLFTDDTDKNNECVRASSASASGLLSTDQTLRNRTLIVIKNKDIPKSQDGPEKPKKKTKRPDIRQRKQQRHGSHRV